MKHQYATLQAGRRQLRLPLSPVRAEMALSALGAWRQPEDGAREQGWFRVIRNDAGPTRVDIFDEISWWGISAQDFIDQIKGVTGDLEVHINSPGGDAFDGIAIYNALASRSGVTTVVDGLAASAASVIYMAGQIRIAQPGAMVMIHDALALCIGNAADMRETAGLLDKVSDNIASVYAAHAPEKSAAEWRAAMVAEGWYTAAEAVESGLAHKVGERPGGGQEPQAAWDRSVFATWQGRCMDGAQDHGHTRPANAAADETAWDGPAAMSWASSQDDPEAAFRAICAGEKTTGEPDTQAHWALPHHKHTGDPPNRKGVSSALGYLDSTDDLKSKSAARAHLEAHQQAMGSGTDDRAGAEFLHDLLEGAL